MVQHVYNVQRTLKKSEANVFLMSIVILIVNIALQVVIKIMLLVLNVHKIVLIVMIRHVIHVLMGSIMIMEFVQHVEVIV